MEPTETLPGNWGLSLESSTPDRSFRLSPWKTTMNWVQHSSLLFRQALFALIGGIAYLGALSGNCEAQEDNHPPKGFTALFNGKDIEEWTGGATRDPHEIKALSADERSKWEARMNQGIEEHWRVEQGELISDGQDPFLATKKDFRDFEMWVDWKIGAGGDSGIYLRGTPQVQIWDPSDKRVAEHGATKGSGGLWNNKKNERFPSQLADRPIGEWNRMYIRMIGPYVTVKLNGKKVVNNVIMENYYRPELPVYAEGPIYLQTHGSETRFRNVFIREIPADEANEYLSKLGKDDKEFKPLTEKDLSSWTGAVEKFEIKDGAIVCKPGHGGNLLTKEQFEDCVVRFEFKLPPGGNSGLALRAPDTQGQLAYAGMEVQILDENNERYTDLQPYQSHGSLYGLAPASRGYLRPVGEWNFQEVSLIGNSLKVVLNGFEILDTDIAEVSKTPLDGKAHPGVARKNGHLGICGHNDPVAIRDFRVKRLTKQSGTNNSN